MSELSRRLPDDNEKLQPLVGEISQSKNLISMAGSKDNLESEFHLNCRELPKVQRIVAQIEWRGDLALLDKPEDPNMEVVTLMATIKMNFEGLGI